MCTPSIGNHVLKQLIQLLVWVGGCVVCGCVVGGCVVAWWVCSGLVGV